MNFDRVSVLRKDLVAAPWMLTQLGISYSS
jgi:hypothetical protein